MHIRVMSALFLLSTTVVPTYAESLKEIEKFASNICNEIRLQGSYSREKIEAKINGEIAGVAKLIGASVSANGKLNIHNEKGLPYEKLAEQISSARDCRREIAKLLIDERKQIRQKKSKLDKAEKDKYAAEELQRKRDANKKEACRSNVSNVCQHRYVAVYPTYDQQCYDTRTHYMVRRKEKVEMTECYGLDNYGDCVGKCVLKNQQTLDMVCIEEANAKCP